MGGMIHPNKRMKMVAPTSGYGSLFTLTLLLSSS